jgi:hypothetical protein
VRLKTVLLTHQAPSQLHDVRQQLLPPQLQLLPAQQLLWCWCHHLEVVPQTPARAGVCQLLPELL